MTSVYKSSTDLYLVFNQKSGSDKVRAYEAYLTFTLVWTRSPISKQKYVNVGAVHLERERHFAVRSRILNHCVAHATEPQLLRL